MGLRVSVEPGRYAVCRFGASEEVPAWAMGGAFWSVTRGRGELSVVCEEAQVEAAERVERGWRALRLEGPFAFDLCGVLASILVPLAEANVGIFALSTFDTDYVLIQEEALPRAVSALAAAGHVIVGG